MDVTAAILSRRSKRSFRPTPVSDETIKGILEVARRAPSGGNLQPWRVYVVNGAARDRLVARIAARLIELPEGETPEYHVYPPQLKQPYRERRSRLGRMMYELLGVGPHDRLGKLKHCARNYRFFDAPAGLFFTLDRSMQQGQWADLGMFMMSVMLLARERGLHTCPQEAWAVWHRLVCEFCGIPAEEIFFCGMAIGYADETAAVNQLEAERVQVEEFVTFIG